MIVRTTEPPAPAIQQRRCAISIVAAFMLLIGPMARTDAEPVATLAEPEAAPEGAAPAGWGDGSSEPKVPDRDRAFDSGSEIEVTALDALEVSNLALLGRVWGFLKYHHPRVAAGELPWDEELIRQLAPMLAAADPEAGRRLLTEWVAALSVPEACDPCAAEPQEAQLLPSLEWLDDKVLLGETLSGQLKAVHSYRKAGGAQYYVSQQPGVGNPVFENELTHADQQPPDAGYRILALLRLWNIIEYWFPYRNQLDDDWPAVLGEFLPRMVAATTWDDYRLELLALIARIRDTHANLRSAFDVRPPRGDCRWPVAMRFIEGRATVTSVDEAMPGGAGGLELGDVVLSIDGRSVESLVSARRPYYSASNSAARMRDIARDLPRGRCAESHLEIERRGELRSLVARRLPLADRPIVFHDRSGPTLQRLSDQVAYLKLSSIRVEYIEGYFEQMADTLGLVIDIRNYPSAFVVFHLGRRLIDQPTPFVRFTIGDLENPGSFTWTRPLTLTPAEPGYRGKVAVLVDEVSISQAEYTAMALAAGPRAVVVGSTTAGADGNVSPIPLPGGLETWISGIGVFHPDKRPTQRVGIVPDIVSLPTLEGVLEGRDEVLESALRYLLGPNADETMIRRLAKRP